MASIKLSLCHRFLLCHTGLFTRMGYSVNNCGFCAQELRKNKTRFSQMVKFITLPLLLYSEINKQFLWCIWYILLKSDGRTNLYRSYNSLQCRRIFQFFLVFLGGSATSRNWHKSPNYPLCQLFVSRALIMRRN